MKNTKLFPVLNTNRFQLRQIIPDDLEHVFKGLSDQKVIQYYGVAYKTLEDTEEQMHFYKQLELTGTGIYWAVCSLDNQLFYGVGGINDINLVHKKAEIGFWLLPEYWGMGFMQEAMFAICEYAFKHVGLNRLEGFVEPENTACKRALEKFGFHYEGTMKDCEIKNGKYISLSTYALFATDVQ